MADSEIRIGKVSSVDYETGMARVTYRDKDDSVTIHLATMNFNDEYRMPEPGQDVVVAHLSNGSSRAVLLGTVWNRKNIPTEGGREIYRKDLSREKNAAYVRYSDKTGEYLIKAANVHINGVNKTVLDGPTVEIAANIGILVQTEEMKVDLSDLELTGGEADKVSAKIKTDVTVNQEENELKAIVLKALFQFVEDLKVQTGMGIEIEAEESIAITAGTDINISSGDTLRFSDGNHSITLAEIIERLGE
ncbi:MAG: phage baseplate assembly protein V [Lachnospiraceae bacterium]|nr:phage baseplate assembly protein V [Lachnospiraceae bacterium]